MSTEEEIRRLMVELRLLEGTAETLQARMSFVNAVLNELNLANKTLEGLAEKGREDTVFVPIGGGSYIKAKLENTDKIVYGVGAGVAIEKTLDETKGEIMNRISELNKTKLALEQQFRQIIQRIQEDQTRFRELTAVSEKQT
ncbi:MAG: prefoldin subunit alpha [Candidatus Bathyarchaeia archaeon]